MIRCNDALWKNKMWSLALYANKSVLSSQQQKTCTESRVRVCERMLKLISGRYGSVGFTAHRFDQTLVLK